MDIKRFDTYRGVAVDENGTKGDVAVVVTDTKKIRMQTKRRYIRLRTI